ncbi:MAG: RNA polymerase sigma factor [Alicyclobacillus sp.]|nr:RNA polymerase sigma factor [Alicyclobacillus sp.]
MARDQAREQVLRRWVYAYADRLTQLAYTYLRDWGRAEDAAQETFIKAYRAMGQLQQVDRPYPWLAKIVINECHSMLRRKTRETSADELPEQAVQSTEDEYFRRSASEQVHHAIMSLPEVFRTPIVLFYVQGLSTQEIAEALGVHPGTVRTRLARGRRRLQKLLGRGEFVEAVETGADNSRIGAAVHSAPRG